MTDAMQNTPIDLGPSYPFQRLLGFRKVLHDTDVARFELDLHADLTNIVGLPHGGVHAALLDTALGSAGCFNGAGQPVRKAVTLNLNISFVSAPAGAMLVAEGRRIGGGRTIYFCEGEVRDDTGRLVARASGTFRYLD